MRYRVLWDDTQDGRSGEPFEVEADTPEAAYSLACGRVSQDGMYGMIIEYLVDEEGRYHCPWMPSTAIFDSPENRPPAS